MLPRSRTTPDSTMLAEVGIIKKDTSFEGTWILSANLIPGQVTLTTNQKMNRIEIWI